MNENISNPDLRFDPLRMHMIIRRFAGVFVLASLALAHFQSPYWLWFTAFVGLNLLQSSFTNFCPLEMILKKFGIATNCCEAGQKSCVRPNEGMASNLGRCCFISVHTWS
jgi:hypothetical protein